MKKLLLSLCLVGAMLVAFAQKPYKIVFYNLENLFDTINDPNKNDEEYLPEGEILYYNPLEMGEVTARALAGILNGTLTLEEGSSLELDNGSTYWLYLFDGILELYVSPLYINTESINWLSTWY